jgi:hypothetical protein
MSKSRIQSAPYIAAKEATLILDESFWKDNVGAYIVRWVCNGHGEVAANGNPFLMGISTTGKGVSTLVL